MRHPRPTKLSDPQRAHPFVRRIYQEMVAQQTTASDVAERSGVGRDTIRSWRGRNSPTLANIEAVLGALGYRLEIVEQKESTK